MAKAKNVRWRADGTDPTSAVGMLMKTTDPPLLLEMFPLAGLEFIEVAAGALLNIHYFKRKV